MKFLKVSLMVVGGICIGLLSVNALQDAPTEANFEKNKLTIVRVINLNLIFILSPLFLLSKLSNKHVFD